VAWDIEFSPEAEQWYAGLPETKRSAMKAAIDKLQEGGPRQGRPAVDSIKGSRHANMKELRSFGGHQRALFSFDPRRTAVILVGGDKSNNWQGWYRDNIRVADRLYDKHLRDIGREGACRRISAGAKSTGRTR
jgi:hypothetical protein